MLLGNHRWSIILWLALIVGKCFGENDERNCSKGQAIEPYPPTVKNTTLLLVELRKLMRDNGVDGYIVPSADDHQTEYVAQWFKRREFITGFTGSAGYAVITLDKAALWADGRYHKQAETELDCNWILMKYGLPKTPKVSTWLSSEIKGKTVGADPRVISIGGKAGWITSELHWKSIDENLIDKIWSNRPTITKNKIFIQPIKYSGQKFTEKIDNLRIQLVMKNTSAFIANTLDDVAWLLNLRGDDIPYNPFFYAYVIVTQTNITLYVDLDKITDEVREHLCASESKAQYCVVIKDYDYAILKQDISNITQNTGKSIWLTETSNIFMAEAVPKEKQYIDFSPIQLPKAMKNDVELAGMRKSNIKDGIAIMEYFVWLKKQIAEKNRVTEISGQEKLKYFKSLQDNFVSLSFASISGFASNGAIIHYKASNITDKEITDQSLYLIDSGAQFHEGSTDITRTIHLGEPTEYQKEMYTYVLKGAIGLARVVFPQGTYGRNLDVLAREYLWQKGLGYMHGTGHGIGSFLSIHEGPGRINTGKIPNGEAAMYNGMVFSDEPGYYENGKFGIRLETAIVVRDKNDTKYRHFNKKFFSFEILTLVPFERKLINIDMLSQDEMDWLNEYNTKIRSIMGPEIKAQGRSEVYDYMMDLTEKFENKSSSGFRAASASYFSYLLGIALSVVLLVNTV